MNRLSITKSSWVPTPSFIYRNYLYRKLCIFLKKKTYFLEVGTGNGEFLKYLASCGYGGESIDYSNAVVSFLNLQKPPLKNISIKKGDILNYQHKRKFDAVFCFEVLEHIKDDNLAIRNISKSLKTGGLFFFSVPAHQKKWSVIDESKGHYRRYEKKDLISKLRTNGFETVKFYNYGFPFLIMIRKFTRMGRFVNMQKKALTRTEKTGISSLNQEYNPKFEKLLSNPIVLLPLFKIMDLFLGYDLGLGYVVLAKKK